MIETLDSQAFLAIMIGCFVIFVIGFAFWSIFIDWPRHERKTKWIGTIPKHYKDD